jgi:hypothetical protein
VSACPSLPIPLRDVCDGPPQAGPACAAADPWGPDLLVALSRVPDPRNSRGVRHRLVTVLAAAVCAVLAGARSYVGIAEWAHDLPVSVRVRLGIGRRAPSESTFRRILQTVDAHALDTAVSSWLVERSGLGREANQALRAIAVDSKTARGSRAPDQPARHLFAAFKHASGVVLGQTEVDDKSNEITAFAPLLDRIDLTGTVITADALHTQDRHATYLHQRGGHYVFIVKNNRPKLRTQLAGLPWRDIRPLTSAKTQGMAGWSHAPSTHRHWLRDHLPARPARRSDRAAPTPEHQRRDRYLAHRDRLRGHRPRLRRHPRRPASRDHPRPPVNREQAALDPSLHQR